ncbi:MAG: hypothetical protein WBA51_04710 [Erythrobacter sp.]
MNACFAVLLGLSAFTTAPLTAQMAGQEDRRGDGQGDSQATAQANTGTSGFAPAKLSRAAQLDPGNGAVIISVRSELYLMASLDVYFVREGGSTDVAADVVRFSRSQSPLAFGNSTVKYKPQMAQLRPGRYRLAGHGVKCPKVPAPDERCIVDLKFAGMGETVSFPSRGYGEDAPVIEVRAGELTVAGDFALTARNTVEWSAIPPDKLRKVQRRANGLPVGPEPVVGERFKLKYPLRARSFEDDRGRRY